jgi:hypothetical protein
LAVAKAFLFLTDLRMDRRNRRTTKWILQKKRDNEPLVAGLDNDAAVRCVVWYGTVFHERSVWEFMF